MRRCGIPDYSVALLGPESPLKQLFSPKKVLWRDFRAILSAKCVNMGYHITRSKPIRVRGVGDMGVGPGWGCGSGQVGPSRAGAGGWGRVTVGTQAGRRRVADSRSTAEAYVRRRRLKNLTLLYPIILSGGSGPPDSDNSVALLAPKVP